MWILAKVGSADLGLQLWDCRPGTAAPQIHGKNRCEGSQKGIPPSSQWLRCIEILLHQHKDNVQAGINETTERERNILEEILLLYIYKYCSLSMP